MPCSWLEWKKHEDGFTTAWIAGEEPGDVATPENWTPEQSRQLSRTDIRDEPGWGIKIAEENGIETWLDYTTGRLKSSLAHRETDPSPVEQKILDAAKMMERNNNPRLMPVARQALALLEWNYEMIGGGQALTFGVMGTHVQQEFLVTVDESLEIVGCYLSSTVRVPEPMRLPVCEFLTRANYGLRVGNFEMDMNDGEVRYKASLDMQGGTLDPKMVMSLFATSGNNFDVYYPGLMRVIYGGISPEVAIRDIEIQ
jgi:hypothetical protein